MALNGEYRVGTKWEVQEGRWITLKWDGKEIQRRKDDSCTVFNSKKFTKTLCSW